MVFLLRYHCRQTTISQLECHDVHVDTKQADLRAWPNVLSHSEVFHIIVMMFLVLELEPPLCLSHLQNLCSPPCHVNCVDQA